MVNNEMDSHLQCGARRTSFANNTSAVPFTGPNQTIISLSEDELKQLSTIDRFALFIVPFQLA